MKKRSAELADTFDKCFKAAKSVVQSNRCGKTERDAAATGYGALCELISDLVSDDSKHQDRVRDALLHSHHHKSYDTTAEMTEGLTAVAETYNQLASGSIPELSRITEAALFCRFMRDEFRDAVQ